MIILVTLMVVASRVLSLPIDDVRYSSYAAIDSSVPIRIDPATITRLYREQSSYPVSSPPFNEGFYYTVPARLLLYQPPPGQSYLAGRASAKEKGNCNNEHSPVGGNVQSPQHQFKRSYDPARISAYELPSANLEPWEVLGGTVQNANYYVQRSDYPKLTPSASVTNGLYSTGSGHLDARYNYPSPNDVQGTSGYFQEQYSRIIPGNAKQATPRVSQDHQNDLMTQSAGLINNRLRDSWPQSTGSIPDPAGIYRIQPSQNLYEKHPSGPDSSPYSRPQHPFYEESNSQKYGELNYAGQLSETVSRQESSPVVSGNDYQTSKNSILGSQSVPMVNIRGDGSNSYDTPSPANILKPQPSQMSPSYLVGFKFLTNTPSSSPQGRNVWELPNFPKHMVGPWASKMYENGGYPSSGYGYQLQTSDSSRAAAPSNFGVRPSSRGILPGTKAGTPWVVLMVPPESLYRKDSNVGMKTPWLSLDDGKDLTFARAGPPPCQKQTLNVAVTQPNQLDIPLEIEQTGVGQVSGLEETTEIKGERSFSTEPLEQFQNRPASSYVIQDQTLMTGGNTVPPTVTKYISSDSPYSQQLNEHTVEGRVSENDAALVGKIRPSGEAQAIIEGVDTGTSMHYPSSDSRQSVGQSNDVKYSTIHSKGGTESNTERPQGESMMLGSDDSSKMVNYGYSSNTGAAKQIEKSATTLYGTTVIEGGHVAPGLESVSGNGIELASNLKNPSMAVESENLIEKMDSQKANELVHSLGSTLELDVSSGSNVVGTVDTGTNKKVIVSEGKKVAGGETKMINNIQLGYATTGSSGTQQVVEEGLAPQTISTAGNGNSGSRVTNYVTEGSDRTTSQLQGIANGSVENSQVDTGTQQTVQQANGLEVTTTNLNYSSTGEGVPGKIGEVVASPVAQVSESSKSQLIQGSSSSQPEITQLNAVPSSSQVINYITEGGTDIESQSSSVNESSSAPHNINTDYLPVVEQDNSVTSTSTVENGASPKIVPNTVDGEKQGSEVEFGPNSSTQYTIPDGTGAIPRVTTTIVKGEPIKTKVIRYITTADGHRREIVDESGLAHENGGLSSVTDANQAENKGVAPISTTIMENGAPTTKIIRYITTADGQRQEIVDESGLTYENGSQSSVTGQGINVGVAPISTTTIENGAPTTKIIRYNTTADGQRQEIDDESGLAHENGSLSSVIDANQPEKKGGAPMSTATIVNGAPTTKTVRYITTVDGQRQEIADEPGLPNENGGLSSVTDTNQAGNKVAPMSTTTIVHEAPTTKIIRYITSADGQRQEIVDESGLAHENAGQSSATDTNQAGNKVAPMSTTTIVNGAPTIKIVRYITTADGQRQEIVDESGLAHENGGLSSVIDANQAENKIAPMSTTTIVNGAPTTKILRYITTVDGQQQEIVDEPGLARENGGLPSGTDVNQAVKKVAPISTTTIMNGAPTTKIVRYITTADGQRQEIVDESGAHENGGLSSLIETNQGINVGAAPLSTTTIVNGAPTTKIVRYITTLDGQRQEIVDESGTHENGDLSSLIETNQGINVGAAPLSTSTIVNGAPTTEIVRYITTVDGQRQEIVDGSGARENGGLSSLVETNQGINVGAAPLSKTTIVNGAPTTKIVRYITTVDGQRQEIVDESGAHENGGLSSLIETNQGINVGVAPMSTTTIVNGAPTTKIVRYITTADGQRREIVDSSVIDTSPAVNMGVVPRSTTTFVKGNPTTSKVIRYIITADGQRQELVDEANLASAANNTNQPSLIRYVTGTNSNSSGQTQFQPGSSTVTRFISSGGASSQFMSGLGNTQSKTIVAGSPSTVTRYSMNYPLHSGSSGLRYIQNFQPRQTSTIMKPASYASGAQSSRNYVMSPASTVVKKS